AAAKGGKTDGQNKKDDGQAVGTHNAREQIQVLAEALKRRSDPYDLKNITIRPSGGEGRVEIVLPTGGTYRAKIAAEKWKQLIADVCKEFGVPPARESYVQVGRGRVLEVAERVQEI